MNKSNIYLLLKELITNFIKELSNNVSVFQANKLYISNRPIVEIQ